MQKNNSIIMKENDIRYWPAVVLAILFGVVGLQEFYVKNLVRGILAVLFCWTFIPAAVAFIQVCVWLYCGKEWFYKRYNHVYAQVFNVKSGALNE